jgi:hypothetical protein
MDRTPGIVYLMRKTNETRETLGEMGNAQFNALIKEVAKQEAEEAYLMAHHFASLMAVVANTIPRRKGSKSFSASDFLKERESQCDEPRKQTPIELAKSKGLRVPGEGGSDDR